MVDILFKIEQEYQSNIDKFSQELIVAQLELLLIYAERFYERQFLTRKKSSYELLDRFESVLADLFQKDNVLENGMPTVTLIAEQLNISPNYLGTLLRLHTQQTTQQHIQNKLIDYAKEQTDSPRCTCNSSADTVRGIIFFCCITS